MFFTAIFVSTLLALSLADNDWSKPCFSGVCEYDLPASAGSASGTLKIWGAETSIADITPAAGWEIIDCSPESLRQDIRLVCNGERPEDCGRLYDGGAEGKIVRLPENCGLNAFAVVAEAYIPQDQNVPNNLRRRDGSTPQVKGLRITTDFKSSTLDTKTGAVNFAIRAANIPGAGGVLDVSSTKQQRGTSRVFPRSIFDFIGGALEKITSLNDFNIDNSTSLDPIDVNKNFTIIDQSISCPPLDARLKIDVDAKAHALVSIGVAASGTIVPPQIDDFAIITGLSADLNGTLDIAAGVTGTADSGKISLLNVGVPGLSFPGILELGPSFQIHAQAKATLDVNIGMTVGLNYKVSNAELVFPPNANRKSNGTFNIEDTPLKLSASPGVQSTGTLEAHLIPSLNLGLSALGGVTDAEIFLELDASATLTLSLEANANVNGSTDHGDSFSTTVSVAGTGMKNTDAMKADKRRMYWNNPASQTQTQHDNNAMQATTIYSMDHASTTEYPVSTSTLISDSATTYGTATESTFKTLNPATAPSPSAIIVTKTVTVKAGEVTGTPSTREGNATNNEGGADKDMSSSFSGCVDIGAGFDVNAGANADFFGFFNQETKVTLFSKKFDLFKRCFGKNVNATVVTTNLKNRNERSRSIFSRSPVFSREYSEFGLPLTSLASQEPSSSQFVHPKSKRAILDLLCPAADTPAAEALADQIISVADIAELGSLKK